MKIGILTCGPLSDEQTSRFGTLADMFQQLLKPHGDDLLFKDYQAYESVLPVSVDECDGWLITGSYHSAYEDLPWIPQLEDFIRRAVTAKAPIIGVCFGHQIMAQALGGKVEKEANRQWGIAVETYKLPESKNGRPSWMSGEVDTISLQASHQDQVVELPEGATLLGGNGFCPNGLIAYGNTGLSMQLHPELSSAFIGDILDRRSGLNFTDDQVTEARARVDNAVDDALVGQWMVAFFRQAAQ